MRERYGRLPRWAQWTIPIVVVLVIVSLATSSSSKKNSGSTTATSSARATRTTRQAKAAPTRTTTSTASVRTTKLGWPTGKPEPTLKTHAQVVSAGDAICRSVTKQIRPLIARLQGLKEEAQAPIQQEAPPLLIKLGKDLFTASVDLQNLPLRPTDKPHVERLAEAIGATGENYNEEAAAITTGDAETVKKDERAIPRTAAMITHFAQSYGFGVCAGL
jgi:hypothetical protein